MRCDSNKGWIISYVFFRDISCGKDNGSLTPHSEMSAADSIKDPLVTHVLN